MGVGDDAIGARKQNLAEEPTLELVPKERRVRLDEGLLDERSRTLFAKLADGDPCGIFERCARRIRERLYLIDAERLFRLSLAHVARAAATQGDVMPQAASSWMSHEVDAAIEMLLREDQEVSRALGACSPNDPRYRSIALTFGIDPAFVPVAVAQFNALPDDVRRVFFALILSGSSISDCVSAGLGSEESLRENVQTAFRALGHLDALIRDTRIEKGRSQP